METLGEDQQRRYWEHIAPVHGAHAAIERFTDGLIAADRPFSAIDAVHLAQRQPPRSTDLLRKALSAPLMHQSAESPQVLRSAEYVVGRLLDQLEEAGVGTADLSALEWFYLPLLAHERLPRALHQRLADDPAFFAEVVSRVYQPDPSPGDEPTPGAAHAERHSGFDCGLCGQPATVQALWPVGPVCPSCYKDSHGRPEQVKGHVGAGRSSMIVAPGRRGRRFESGHPDQETWPDLRKRRSGH